jgi:leucyl-tRNA synthetase
VPVPEEELPVPLPNEVRFKPTGESPLREVPEFLNTTCPVCGGPATRETDTMDTFICSSWYFLRYADPHDAEHAWTREMTDHWLPVDMYIGGPEHATMHLLYARFFVKALRDMGLLGFDEPFRRLYHQGMVLGPDGQKMSKSRGNVIAPDDVVGRYGADAVRCYLMFMGPFDQGGPWNNQGIEGVWRFLNRAWALVEDHVEVRGTLPGKIHNEDIEGQGSSPPTPLLARRGEKGSRAATEDGPHPQPLSREERGAGEADGSLAQSHPATGRGAGGRTTVRPYGEERGAGGAAELAVARLRHKMVKRVTEHYAALQFNTALAALMELTNGLNRAREEAPAVVAASAFADAAEALVVLLAPLAPHIAEELWHRLGHATSVHAEAWPTYDEALTRDTLVTVVIQVNGKLRDKLELAPDVAEEEVRERALASERVRAALDGRGVRKFIYVPGKLANVVG